MEFMGESENKIIKGKSFEVYDKIIYTVTRISIQKDYNGNIIAAGVIPIAIIVEEDNDQYIIPIIDELADIDDESIKN